MISSMALVGGALILMSLAFLAYINNLYATHDAEVNAERSRAGLAPVANSVVGATPLVGVFLAIGGSGAALGVVLVVLSAAILF